MTTTLAHRNDPQTSHDAAENLDASKTELVKGAILALLGERPRAAFELRTAYFELAKFWDWPQDIQPHSIARRLSELHKAGFVRPVILDGETVRIPSPDGATATVWELT